MSKRTRFCLLLALLSLLAFMTSSGGDQGYSLNTAPMNFMQTEGATKIGVVYVCACLKTKSCFCMTEAKTEGPCACGTKGGPPLKAVPSQSTWAQANREALAQ